MSAGRKTLALLNDAETLLCEPLLAAFVVIVFWLTIVKVSRQDANGNPPAAEVTK